MSATRRAPHEHGFRVDSECPHELCRAFYRGYQRGVRRERRDARTRNAAMIAELREANRRPDYEDGPVRRTLAARPDGGRPPGAQDATRGAG